MGRIRTIKPEFFIDDDVAAIPAYARLLFIGLWTCADRQGRLEDRPARIKTQLLPYDDVDVDGLLGTLVARGFVVRYQQEGRRYIAIRSWAKHQRPNQREAESQIPAPPDLPGVVTCMHVNARVEGKGREGKGKEDAQVRVQPSLIQSRRGHLDHVYCGTRFCIQDFVVNDCWEMASDVMTRDQVAEHLRQMAPQWEADVAGKELKSAKAYVRERFRGWMQKFRADRDGATRDSVYECGVCHRSHRGHPREGCKDAAFRKATA
jgi:hypothetical protein